MSTATNDMNKGFCGQNKKEKCFTRQHQTNINDSNLLLEQVAIYQFSLHKQIKKMKRATNEKEKKNRLYQITAITIIKSSEQPATHKYHNKINQETTMYPIGSVFCACTLCSSN